MDLFNDCFTGDELVELELVATQAENKQNLINLDSYEKPVQLVQKASISNPSFVSEAPTNLVKEVRRLQAIAEGKSGEVRLLRDKVGSLERLLSSERQAKLAQEKSRKDDLSQRELEMKRTIDICKDRLEFKDAELQEAYSVIKSLESKHSAKKPRFSEGGFRSDAFQTKLKIAKPENPRVPQRSAPDSASTAKTNIPSSNRRAHSIERRCKGDFIPPSQHRHFYELCSFFTQHNRSLSSELFSATQRLLCASYKEESVTQDVETVIQLTVCSLVTLRGGGACGAPPCCCEGFSDSLDSKSAVIPSLFHVLALLFPCFPSPPDPLVERAVRVASRYYQEEKFEVEALRLLALLIRQLPPHRSPLFQPTTAVLRPSRDPVQSNLVFEFLCSCVSRQELTELLLHRAGCDSPLLIRLCLSSVNQEVEGSTTTVHEKIIHLFTSLVTHCDVIITRERCGSDVFHVICLILSKLLEQRETRLLDQCLYCLYVCVTSLGPEPGLVRRIHQAALWEAKDLLESRSPKTLWKEELARIITQDFDPPDQ